MEKRDLEAVRLLARTFVDAGRFAAAGDLLNGLIEIDPDDAFARRNLVLVRLRLGDYAGALPLARRLAEEAGGTERAPALFFYAYALWGMGREAERQAEVERYAACLNEL